MNRCVSFFCDVWQQNPSPTHMNAHVHKHLHAYMHTHACARAHTHTHTYTHLLTISPCLKGCGCNLVHVLVPQGGLVFVCGSKEGLMQVSNRRHNTDDIIATVLAVEPMKFIYRGRSVRPSTLPLPSKCSAAALPMLTAECVRRDCS